MNETQPINFTHLGAELEGQMVLPSGTGPFPAVLVMASAFGLDAQMLNVAHRLAALGYVAVATDMYGGGAYYPDPSQTAAPFAAVMSPPGLVRARAMAWLDTVAARPEVDASRVAAIGYCFGGKCVLELARSGADVKAVVSYHGLLTTDLPAAKGAIKGEVVAYCGHRDPYALPEHIEGLRAELEAAGARHQITIFSEAAHSFTIPNAEKSGLAGVEYHELSDRISWAGTVALLEAMQRH